MSKSEAEREKDGNGSTCTRLIWAPGCRTMAGNECMELFPANGHACPLSRVSWPRAALRSAETSLSVRSSGRGWLLIGKEGGGAIYSSTKQHHKLPA